MSILYVCTLESIGGKSTLANCYNMLCLLQLGQERTLCYKVNGYLLLVTFFVVRLLNIPFDVIVYAAQYHGWNIFQALLKLHLTCYVSIIIMYIMQIYWFSMIFKLAMKGLRDMREREREEAEKKAKSD